MCGQKITLAQNDINIKRKYPPESNSFLHKSITDLLYLSTCDLQTNGFKMRLKAHNYTRT